MCDKTKKLPEVILKLSVIDINIDTDDESTNNDAKGADDNKVEVEYSKQNVDNNQMLTVIMIKCLWIKRWECHDDDDDDIVNVNTNEVSKVVGRCCCSNCWWRKR